jgi:hypothetical protein
MSNEITEVVVPDIISDRPDDNFNHKITYKNKTYWVDSADLMKKIKALKRTINTGYLDLARYLFYITTFKLHKIWGVDSFKDFCLGIVDLNPRTAHYYISIYSILIEEMGVSKDSLIKIGWSKAKEIVRLVLKGVIVTQDDLKMWMLDASNMNLKDFEGKVRSKIREADGKDEVPEFETVKFKVRKEDMPHIRKAINLSKKMLATENQEVAQNASLSFMAQEWITQYGEEADFLLMIRRMESRHKVDITIQRDGEILYPEKSLPVPEGQELVTDYEAPSGAGDSPNNVVETTVIEQPEQYEEGSDNIEEIDDSYEEYEEYEA